MENESWEAGKWIDEWMKLPLGQDLCHHVEHQSCPCSRRTGGRRFIFRTIKDCNLPIQTSLRAFHVVHEVHDEALVPLQPHFTLYGTHIAENREHVMRLIRKILFSGHIWVEILPYPGGYLRSCSSKQHLNLSESTFMCYIVGNFRRRMYVVVFCLLRGKLHIRYWRDNDGPASRQSVPISEIVVQIGIFFLSG